MSKKRLKSFKRNLMMKSVRDVPRIEYIYRYASLSDCMVMKYNRDSSKIVSDCANSKLQRILRKHKIAHFVFPNRMIKNKRG